MRPFAALPFAALALSACTMAGGPPPEPLPPPPSGETYRALGTEPFWSVTIGGGTMRYDPADGRAVSVATPRPIVGINGELYRTRRLTVDITHVRCSDGMSDRVYPDTVRVTVEGRELRGCGGGATEEAMTLDGTSWRLVSIGGQAAIRSTMAFAEGRISGRACNRYGGPYRVEGDRLVAGAIVATRMACEGPVMQEENRLFEALRGPLDIRERTNRRLVLVSPDKAHRIVLTPA